MGPMTHAAWLSSVVFDGARAFDGVAPDLDRHCQRCVESAYNLGLIPTVEADEIERVAWAGIHQFPKEAELYIRPMFFATEGFIVPVPESTRFVLSVYEAQMPKSEPGFTACLTRFRRPRPDMAPTDSKCAALYPNVARMMSEAAQNGFETALVLDPEDNVAEFANANLFMVKDGAVSTPEVTGTFLNGITRQRVIQLLRDAGTDVQERTITLDEVHAADELFSSGNWAKVQNCKRLEGRDFQPGPTFRQARDLYIEFARNSGAP